MMFRLLMALLLAGVAGAAEVARPVIPDATFTVTDYGAVGDGKTMSTDAIAKAIDACKSAGGGVVVVPRGTFLTGPFELVGKMNLRVDEGATLRFTDDFDAYPVTNNRHRHAIAGEGLSDLAITGKGSIDGDGGKWWTEFRKVKGTPDEKKQPRRPNLIDLTRCRRVLVQDVLITNSPMFHLVPRDCDDVTIEGARFIAPEDAPNTDGIDPSGHNYLITRCHFDVGDDCIAIKPQHATGGARLSCEDMLITDCTFLHGHGLSIGGQTPGGLRRMTVRNCTFDGTDAGIRMKAPRGQGGLVEDLTYENITMTNVKVPILITSYYPKIPADVQNDSAQAVAATTPIWRNIRISNVTSQSSPIAGQIIGLPEMPVENVVLTNVRISAAKGMQIVNAKAIEFKNSQIDAAKGEPLQTHNADVTGLATAGEK